MSRARRLGEHTARWAESMVSARGIEGVRVLQGLLALAKQHDCEAIERACQVAFSHGAWRLKTILQLLKRDAPEQEAFEFLQEHPIIRSLSDYGKLVSISFQRPGILTKYLKPDLLIVDDMGMKQLPKRSGEYLFEIIMRRYETRSTMMTSNRPLEDWGKLIGDIPSATAILDRFLHHAEIVTITGRSYRLRNQSSQTDASNGNGQLSKETKRMRRESSEDSSKE